MKRFMQKLNYTLSNELFEEEREELNSLTISRQWHGVKLKSAMNQRSIDQLTDWFKSLAGWLIESLMPVASEEFMQNGSKSENESEVEDNWTVR